MTRINTIDPRFLTDEHCFAEWRELPRCFHYVNGQPSTVPTYRMGAGHVLFFRDKTGWLARRHAILTQELEIRGYNLSISEPLRPVPGADVEWEPESDAHETNLERLQARLITSKRRQRFFGEPIHDMYLDTWYSRLIGAIW